MDLKERQQLYWASYRQLRVKNDPETRWPKASPQAYYDRSCGIEGVKLSAHVGFTKKRVTLHIVFQKAGADARFKQLKRDKDRFEAAFGEPLEWLANAESDRHIRVTLQADPTDKADWPRQHAWLYNKMQRFHQTFDEAVKTL